MPDFEIDTPDYRELSFEEALILLEYLEKKENRTDDEEELYLRLRYRFE